mmetsp:Transcript_11723/g.21244  ORF Transcript_11723/g.21244 Transcript_11723/m.21244 type:complete len:323 (+) Transcript_11723:457-1425(+)
MRNCLLLLLANQIVDDGVQEHTADTDRAAYQLHGVQTLTQNNGAGNDDDDALSGVGNGLSHGTSLLHHNGGQLVVQIEPQSSSNDVEADNGVGLPGSNQPRDVLPLSEQNQGQRHEPRHGHGDSELVTNSAQPIRQAGCVHRFLVLVTLDSGKCVGNQTSNESTPGKVQLTGRGQAHTPNDGDQGEPLGSADRRAIEQHSEKGSKCRLKSLDNLAKGYSTSGHGKYGPEVGTGECNRKWQHLHHISPRDGRELPCIGGSPQEQSVEHTNCQLHACNGQWGTIDTTCGLQCQLIGNVVVVVSDVPKGQAQKQTVINTLEFVHE